jgi:HPr kinase/phosphorylase
MESVQKMATVKVWREASAAMAKKVRVAELVQHFGLKVVSGNEGLSKPILGNDLHRPGLALAGYTNYYPADRVQILGKTEIAFLRTLTAEERLARFTELCADVTPCFVVTRGLEAPMELITASESKHMPVPVLSSPLPTTIIASRITTYLEGMFAPSTTVHGVLVDVYGVGMLITGASGIGKSETALELVKRNHRLVADDAVEIRQTSDGQLYGSAPELIRHLLEVRGLGIINVMTLFGAGAVRNTKQISVVVELELWQEEKQYDRLGLDNALKRVIDTDLPLVTMPVRPGRNLAVLIEVAAMNYRLKRMGHNAALLFTNKLNDRIADDTFEFD